MILFQTLSTSCLFGFFQKTRLVVMVMRLRIKMMRMVGYSMNLWAQICTKNNECFIKETFAGISYKKNIC